MITTIQIRVRFNPTWLPTPTSLLFPSLHFCAKRPSNVVQGQLETVVRVIILEHGILIPCSTGSHTRFDVTILNQQPEQSTIVISASPRDNLPSVIPTNSRASSIIYCFCHCTLPWRHGGESSGWVDDRPRQELIGNLWREEIILRILQKHQELFCSPGAKPWSPLSLIAIVVTVPFEWPTTRKKERNWPLSSRLWM